MDLSERPAGSFARHPWEVARCRFFLRVLGSAGLLRAPRRVLDVGSGDAWLAREVLARLPAGSSIACWDVGYSAGDLRAVAAGAPGMTCRVDRPGGPFDLVLLLDVLEHVEDDGAFLRETVARNVAAGGAMLVSVPAWPTLFGPHDERLSHHRRYTPAGTLRLLRDAGLRPTRRGGLFHSLLLPRAADRVLRGLGIGAAAPPGDLGTWRHGPAATRLVAGALAVDNAASLALSRLGLDLPGLSWWALCTRTT